MFKHFTIIILILFSVGISSATIEFKNSTYTLTFEINDTVFTEDDNIYIEGRPHTIYKDGYVFFNFSFKKYVGNVDIYLGFTDSSYPVNISILNKKEYIQVRNKVETQRHKLNNKEYWHYVTNVQTIKNNSVRVWIDIKEGVENGKYDFAIKPTGKSMIDSINDKEFYILDPYYESWYNSKCPCDAYNPDNIACNNKKFIDLGNKNFLYIQSTYLCGDVDGNGDLDARDIQRVKLLVLGYMYGSCNFPIINYEIFEYNNYVGTNIIRPNKSDEYD